MVRVWPWTEFDRLKSLIEWHDKRRTEDLFRLELRENVAMKAMRELSAANKGIRRLKDRVKKLEGKP